MNIRMSARVPTRVFVTALALLAIYPAQRVGASDCGGASQRPCKHSPASVSSTAAGEASSSRNQATSEARANPANTGTSAGATREAGERSRSSAGAAREAVPVDRNRADDKPTKRSGASELGAGAAQ